MATLSNQGKIDISCWDGTISQHEFHRAASAFAERWNKFNAALPQCSWVARRKSPYLSSTSKDEGYLSVENVIMFPTPAAESSGGGDDKEGEEELSCSRFQEDDFIDGATMLEELVQAFLRFIEEAARTATSTNNLQNHDDASHHYDFHVVYNASYRVPVLYFRAYCSDGRTLVLDDVEKSIPAISAKLLMLSKWTFITQEDHPYLNCPWYTLHPCGTSEWMKMLFSYEPAVDDGGVAVANYLVSWFSVAGQVFGLKIPFEMLSSIGKAPKWISADSSCSKNYMNAEPMELLLSAPKADSKLIILTDTLNYKPHNEPCIIYVRAKYKAKAREKINLWDIM